jgi:hypothetical protein
VRGLRRSNVVFALLTIALGVALIARTIEAGVGGGLGLVLGGLALVAGVLRLYLLR